MELLLELALTVFLSLSLTIFIVKLIAMQPIATDKDEFTEEAVKIAKFQLMPSQGELIELEERKDEGKSLVDFHNVRANFEDQESGDLKEEDEETSFEDEETSFEDEDGSRNGGERKSIEIEIESVEDEGKSEMSDWEEIERQDYEELLGNNRAGLYVEIASGK